MTNNTNLNLNCQLLYFSYPIIHFIDNCVIYNHFRVLEDKYLRINGGHLQYSKKICTVKKSLLSPLYKKEAYLFLSKLDNTSLTIICAIQYSKSKDFLSYKREKKLSDLCSHTVAVVEVAPPLIFSQLDSCLPPCLL